MGVLALGMSAHANEQGPADAAANTSAEDGAGFIVKRIRETFPSGAKRLEYTARVYPQGRVEKHGDYVEYLETGEVFRSGQFAADKREGKWQYFDGGGQLVKSGSYAAGRLHGDWTFFEEGKK